MTLKFTLPDGSLEQLTLTAVAADAQVVNPNEFKIGANSTETLNNLRATLGTQLDKLVRGPLAAASAVKAGEDFFKGEPNASAGPPPVEKGIAKRLVPGPNGMKDAVNYDTPQNAQARTVRWYQGDLVSENPRATASAEVDNAQSIFYGARADEEALRTTVQYMAVASTLKFAESDPNGLGRFQALTPRIVSGLSMEKSTQTIHRSRSTSPPRTPPPTAPRPAMPTGRRCWAASCRTSRRRIRTRSGCRCWRCRPTCRQVTRRARCSRSSPS